MSLRTIDPTSLGPRPRPSTAFPQLALAALNAEVLPDDLPSSCAPADKINGVVHASGHSRIRHVNGDMIVYPTGLLAPADDATLGEAETTTASVGAYWDVALNGAYFPYNDDCILSLFRWWGGTATAPGFPVPSHFLQLHQVRVLSGIPNEYWEVLLEPDPVDTLQNMADAINHELGTLGTKWNPPDEANPAYRCLQTTSPRAVRAAADPYFIAAVGDTDTLRIWRRQYGETFNDLLITLGTRISFDDSFALDGPPLPSVPSFTGGATSNPCTSRGYWPESRAEGTVAHVEGYSGDDADFDNGYRVMEMWDAGTGTRNIFRLMFQPVLGVANQYWQIVVQGTSAQTAAVVENLFRGIPDTRYRAPDTALAAYDSVGIEDWEFLYGYNASAGSKMWFCFRTKTTGERKNRAKLYQNCFWTGLPDPLQGTSKDCSGGSDPIADTRIGLETPGPGDYIYRPAWYRKGDIARSGFGKGLEVDNGDGGTIVVGGFPTPDDPSVDYLRLYRSLQQGLGDFFKAADIPLADDPFTDDLGDKEIAGTFGSLLYNPREYRHREAGYPPKFRHLIRHLGSVWGSGISRSAPQKGSATFVKDSDEIIVAGPTVVTPRWIGRYIGADDSADTYRVVLADTATGVVTIGKPYEGESTYAPFSCIDGRRSTKVGRAEPGLVNQWPTAREFHGIDSLDELGVTAMAHTKLRLFLWTRDSTWVLQGSSPTTFSLDPIADGIGALNHRSMVVHNGVAYWLEGPEGFYAWAFEGVPQRISNPPFSQNDDPVGIQDTVDRINWDASAAWAHGLADPDGRRIRWWVCVDGSEVPNCCITLDLKSASWATETCEGITSACRATKSDGSLVVLAGDVGGRIWELDQGDSDGAHDFDPVIVLETAGTTGLVTVPALALPAAGVEGCPFLIVHKDGTTETGTVGTHGTGSLVPYELLEQAPTIGDVLVVGGIDLDIEPNRFHQGVPEELKSVPMLWIYTDQGEGEFYLWVGVDNDELAVPRYDSPVGSAAAVNGIERFRINQIGNQHGFRIRAFVPGTRLALRRFTMQTDYRQLNQVPR